MKSVFFVVLSIFSLAALHSQTIDKSGKNIKERFLCPDGFERVQSRKGSFGEYLREFPLKDFGSPVLLYNGEKKRSNVHVSVFDMPLVDADLIQCADAVMKLRAEYLYREKRFDEICFHITNSMEVPFSRFVNGERVIVSGNKTEWKGGFKKGSSRDIFEQYLRFIYAYAGTLSLSREAKQKALPDIEIGDFFIFGGSPGHVVLVLDVAKNREGKKIMLLGQSYMPSQEFHVLKSFENISPWYFVEDDVLRTPEWTFEKGCLRSFD